MEPEPEIEHSQPTRPGAWIDVPGPMALSRPRRKPGVRPGTPTLKSVMDAHKLKYGQYRSARTTLAFQVLVYTEDSGRMYVRNVPAFLAWWWGFGMGPAAVDSWRDLMRKENNPAADLPEPTRNNNRNATAQVIMDTWERRNRGEEF